MTRNQIAFQELQETIRHNLTTEQELDSRIALNRANATAAYAGAAANRASANLNMVNAAYRQRELDNNIPEAERSRILAQTSLAHAQAKYASAQANKEEALLPTYTLQGTSDQIKLDAINSDFTASFWKRNVRDALTEGYAADYYKQATDAWNRGFMSDVEGALHPLEDWIKGFTSVSREASEGFGNVMKALP